MEQWQQGGIILWDDHRDIRLIVASEFPGLDAALDGSLDGVLDFRQAGDLPGSLSRRKGRIWQREILLVDTAFCE